MPHLHHHHHHLQMVLQLIMHHHHHHHLQMVLQLIMHHHHHHLQRNLQTQARMEKMSHRHHLHQNHLLVVAVLAPCFKPTQQPLLLQPTLTTS